jgi:hypothetical protein
MSVLDDPHVCAQLRQAWEDSQPDTADAHEEGGFVLQGNDGSLVVERWPRGIGEEIEVPPFASGRRNQLIIVVTFHTHPNSGAGYVQRPSPEDVEAVRDDPDLGHPEYQGEYVISKDRVYRILRSGAVDVVGATRGLLGTAP